MFVLQHALTQGVIRRRAPLDASVTAAVRDALEEGDWLTIRSDTGLFEPVATAASLAVSRLAWPIVIEPSQPDAVSAGLTVVHGTFFAQTDRYAADPTFLGYAAPDVPDVSVRATAPAYAGGGSLVAMAFDSAAGLGGVVATMIHGVTTMETGEEAFVVAYIERAPADNNGLLQLVVF